MRRFTLGNREFEAAHSYEDLVVEQGVEVLAAWSNRYADGLPMGTLRQVGKGRVAYVGTYLTAGLAEALADRLFAEAGVEPLVGELPEGVEVTLRTDGKRRLLFVQNCRATGATVAGMPAGVDLLDGSKRAEGQISLDGYGCAIILHGT